MAWRITFKVPTEIHDELRAIVEYGTKQGEKGLTVDRYCRMIVLDHLRRIREEIITASKKGLEDGTEGTEAREDEVSDIPTEIVGTSPDSGEDL